MIARSPAVQSQVLLTKGQLPWDIAAGLPEEYIEGWEIACAELRAGKEFDFKRDKYSGRRIGFGVERVDPDPVVEANT